MGAPGSLRKAFAGMLRSVFQLAGELDRFRVGTVRDEIRTATQHVVLTGMTDACRQRIRMMGLEGAFEFR